MGRKCEGIAVEGLDSNMRVDGFENKGLRRYDPENVEFQKKLVHKLKEQGDGNIHTKSLWYC